MVSRRFMCSRRVSTHYHFGLGKTTFFVANQANMETVSPEKLASLEAEYKTIDEANKLRANEIRVASAGE
jgi:hypothetical protein